NPSVNTVCGNGLPKAKPSTQRRKDPPMKKMQYNVRFGLAYAVALLAAFAFAGCAQDDKSGEGVDGDTGEEQTSQSGSCESAVDTAELTNVEDDELGQVEFYETDGGTEHVVDVKVLVEGFYGFHVHEIGECETDSQAPD